MYKIVSVNTQQNSNQQKQNNYYTLFFLGVDFDIINNIENGADIPKPAGLLYELLTKEDHDYDLTTIALNYISGQIWNGMDIRDAYNEFSNEIKNRKLDEYFTPDIMERVKNRIDLLIELKAQLG